MQSCMLWAQAGEKVARAEPLSIWEGFRATFEPLAELLPRLGVALLILIVGYLISQLLGRLATMLSDRLGLQAAARRSGLAESMQRAGMASSLPALVGSLVFWLLMGCWLLVAFGVMGAYGVALAMQQLLQYTPRLIFAVVLVIVGLLIAKLVHGIVAMAGDRGGLLHSATLARICYYVGVIITFVAAANHLGIAFRLLEQVSLIVLAGLTAGGALALGLGGQHVASELLAGYFVRMRFRPGDEVRLADLQGTVREVGAVSTVLETIDSDGLTHRRSVPNSKLLKEGLK